jgi:4a-hydroxytetrahydrobiopterin dehydratase
MIAIAVCGYLLKEGGGDMSKLAIKQCLPCKGGVPSLSDDEKKELLVELKDWEMIDNKRLEKEFCFSNFAQALAWTNVIGAISEGQNHHPEIVTGWGKVKVQIWTHKIDDLVEADYILAAKIDKAESLLA